MSSKKYCVSCIDSRRVNKYSIKIVFPVKRVGRKDVFPQVCVSCEDSKWVRVSCNNIVFLVKRVRGKGVFQQDFVS